MRHTFQGYVTVPVPVLTGLFDNCFTTAKVPVWKRCRRVIDRNQPSIQYRICPRPGRLHLSRNSVAA